MTKVWRRKLVRVSFILDLLLWASHVRRIHIWTQRYTKPGNTNFHENMFIKNHTTFWPFNHRNRTKLKCVLSKNRRRVIIAIYRSISVKYFCGFQSARVSERGEVTIGWVRLGRDRGRRVIVEFQQLLGYSYPADCLNSRDRFSFRTHAPRALFWASESRSLQVGVSMDDKCAATGEQRSVSSYSLTLFPIPLRPRTAIQ